MGNVEFINKKTELVSKFIYIVLYRDAVSVETKEEFKEIKKTVSQVLNKTENNITEFLEYPYHLNKIMNNK